MFDLVSTRESTDELTAKCARLLAAVIAQAVHDAAQRPTMDEQKRQQNLNADAREAVVWLFDQDQVVFPAYCRLIGANAQTIREALLQPHYTEHALFALQSRRIIRARHDWWKAESLKARQQDKPGRHL